MIFEVILEDLQRGAYVHRQRVRVQMLPQQHRLHLFCPSHRHRVSHELSREKRTTMMSGKKRTIFRGEREKEREGEGRERRGGGRIHCKTAVKCGHRSTLSAPLRCRVKLTSSGARCQCPRQRSSLECTSCAEFRDTNIFACHKDIGANILTMIAQLRVKGTRGQKEMIPQERTYLIILITTCD